MNQLDRIEWLLNRSTGLADDDSFDDLYAVTTDTTDTNDEEDEQ